MMKCSKTFKSLLSLTLAAVLCLGGMTAAFADPGPAGNDDVHIQKVLQTPQGTPIPAAAGFSFYFDFTAKYYDTDGNTLVNGVQMPVPNAIQIDVLSTDTPVTNIGLDTYTKASGKIFDGVAWTAPGMYVYEIAERATTYTNAATGETMTDSTVKYQVVAYVENDSPSGFKVADIVVWTLDPSTGDRVAKIDTSTGFVFTNVYEVNGGQTAANPALTVSKTVATNPKADYNRYFPFQIDTTIAATQTGTVTYLAYLKDATGIIAPVAANGEGTNFTATTDGSGKSCIAVTPGTPLNINLKHGQSVAFVDMLVGSTFTAKETAVANYQGSIALTLGGSSSNIPTPGYGAEVSTGEARLGAGENTAAFTNEVNATAITPTGISTNDLPFIAMILLAIGAMAAYVVIKSRKKSSNEN